MQSLDLADFTGHSILGLICAIECIGIGWIVYFLKMSQSRLFKNLNIHIDWLYVLHPQVSDFQIGDAELFPFSE